ncbi:uncharacterized protein Tco025E_05897 [Trypanosoma conorhini]|uniref:Uncharacterized protein n=1 Tax=Trypanosoma conorhini TaxID=83891 RepID=A0A422P9C1_9TRYP|nr:uncharacterized protein Tco025E_05897 [Trypanosoma conorhini]RNF14329.1 hypothetical protein Tco025E_05897 [Trypanosoma conorhini]
MEVGIYQDAIAAAKQGLNALRLRTSAAEAEQERKEALLREILAKVDARQREKECVWHRKREIAADTVSTLNELRAIEELDMLESMLVEKNTQLRLQQYRHDTLLQQLANLETILDELSLEGDAAGSAGEAQSAQWASCCEQLSRCIAAADRYCGRHSSHVFSHPVSVIQKSIRNMCRIVREREERLKIQHEHIDTQLQHAASLDDSLQGMEENSTCKMEELRRGHKELMQAMEQRGVTETRSLRGDLWRAAEARQHLLRRLEDEGLLPVEAELPPLLLGLCSAEDASPTPREPCETGQVNSVDVSSEGVGNSHPQLRSVQVLRRPRLVGKETASAITAVMGPCSTNNKEKGRNTTGDGTDDAETDATATEAPAVCFEGEAAGSSLHRGVDPAPDAMNSELEELEGQVIAAERDVDRLQQRYETLGEEAERIRDEYAKDRKALEEKLSAAQEAVSVLAREKSEWQALHQQMSLLIS